MHRTAIAGRLAFGSRQHGHNMLREEVQHWSCDRWHALAIMSHHIGHCNFACLRTATGDVCIAQVSLSLKQADAVLVSASYDEIGVPSELDALVVARARQSNVRRRVRWSKEHIQTPPPKFPPWFANAKRNHQAERRVELMSQRGRRSVSFCVITPETQ
jgi:hypothetical protein